MVWGCGGVLELSLSVFTVNNVFLFVALAGGYPSAPYAPQPGFAPYPPPGKFQAHSSFDWHAYQYTAKRRLTGEVF